MSSRGSLSPTASGTSAAFIAMPHPDMSVRTSWSVWTSSEVHWWSYPHTWNMDDYESYLAVFPGSQLARIYDRWGARLLEQNVRVFLQARGNVNSGIRNTLANDPEMFFAYNNGITATAESIETVESPTGLLLTGMRNFQIVNGGSDHGVHTCSTPEQGLSTWTESSSR